jgi:hypothetical protein
MHTHTPAARISPAALHVQSTVHKKKERERTATSGKRWKQGEYPKALSDEKQKDANWAHGGQQQETSHAHLFEIHM